MATILKSPKATQATLDIIQAFTKLRELSRTLIDITQYSALVDWLRFILTW